MRIMENKFKDKKHIKNKGRFERYIAAFGPPLNNEMLKIKRKKLVILLGEAA